MAFLPQAVIMRASQFLAIQGDDLPAGQFLNRTNPAQKTFPKFIGIEQSKDAPKGIMGQNPVGQFQESTQPIVFGDAPGFRIRPRIRTTNAGANRDDENILQLVLQRITGAGICQGCQVLGNRLMGSR